MVSAMHFGRVEESPKLTFPLLLPPSSVSLLHDVGWHTQFAPVVSPRRTSPSDSPSSSELAPFWHLLGAELPLILFQPNSGGLVQLLAGMWEFATGNTFGAT